MKTRITENLDIDIEKTRWECHHCHADLGDARVSYKRGCLIAQREPREIWDPIIDEQVTFSYDGGWARIVEFYCPGCGWLIEVEVLPPGHPITDDISLDLEALRAAAEKEEG